MNDTETLLQIHDILFGPQAIAKDEVQLYTEVAMVMIGWAQTYFATKEGS